MTKINVFDDSMRIEEFDIMLGTMRDQMDQRMNRFEVVQSCELIIDLIFMVSTCYQPPCSVLPADDGLGEQDVHRC